MAALGSNMKGKKQTSPPADKPKEKKAEPKKVESRAAAKPIKKKPAPITSKKETKKPVKAAQKPAEKVEKPKKEAAQLIKKEAKTVKKVAKPVKKAEKPVKKETKPVSKPAQQAKEEAPVQETSKHDLRNAKFILEPSKRRKIRKTKVIMEGELTINNVDAFMKLVNPIFKDYDFIDFYLREVRSLDLSHIQMLYYYQKHHIKKGKTITIDSELSPDLKSIMVNAGFKELMFIPKLV